MPKIVDADLPPHLRRHKQFVEARHFSNVLAKTGLRNRSGVAVNAECEGPLPNGAPTL